MKMKFHNQEPNLIARNFFLVYNDLFFRYRLAVIKALPQLQKLDNVDISREELQEAQRRGKNLYLPNEAHEESEEEYGTSSPPQQYQRYENYSPEYSPPQLQSPPRQEVGEEMSDFDSLLNYVVVLYKHWYTTLIFRLFYK